ncbi:MAG: hypothetical protein QNJ73_04870 [Gammaproteobacteria bacterium]|nr:hypothetical protein [Gammaproteobacteria bacterium]
MNDQQFRDFCAASAVSGLVARYGGDDDELRHHFHVICAEAFRLAEEMVEYRQQHNAREQARLARTG